MPEQLLEISPKGNKYLDHLMKGFVWEERYGSEGLSQVQEDDRHVLKLYHDYGPAGSAEFSNEVKSMSPSRADMYCMTVRRLFEERYLMYVEDQGITF